MSNETHGFMRTEAWILMLSVQIPVLVVTAYLFKRILGDDKKNEKKD